MIRVPLDQTGSCRFRLVLRWTRDLRVRNVVHDDSPLHIGPNRFASLPGPGDAARVAPHRWLGARGAWAGRCLAGPGGRRNGTSGHGRDSALPARWAVAATDV